MKTKMLLIFLLLHCFAGNSQNQDREKIKKILEQVQSKYENSAAYDYLISYKMYKGSAGTKVEKEYDGRVAKSGKSLFYEAAGTETVFTEGKYIRASHEQKLIEYGKSNGDEASSSPLDLKKYLQYFKNGTMEDKGSYWICTLTVGKFTALSYNRIELFVNKDYTLSKQVLYYLKQIPFKNAKGKEEYDYPRLEVQLTKNQPKKQETLFDIKKYVAFKDDKVTPSTKLKGYKIIDLSKK